MTSRERVLRAFHKIAGRPDRPPMQFDLCRQLTDHFQEALGIAADYSPSYYEDLTYRISANEIRTALGSDCIVVGGTVPSGYEARKLGEGVSLNEFGMEMKPTALYVEVVKCPLKEAASIDDIAAYDFPDAYAQGRFDKAARDIDRFGRDYFVIGDCELSVFELAWHLTGMQEYLMAMAMEEPWIDALNDRVEAWTLGLAEQLTRLGVDAIWFGEDLGSQSSTLISPDMWRRSFKPRYARMISALKKINPALMVIMHSDGAVAPLIDDFIEMGIEVYNPVQPNVTGSDPQELADKYGGRICFFGGIDQQGLLPSGDIPALLAEIRRRARILGKEGGYLMAPAHIIQADTSPEMVLAMIEAVKSLG
jgi:uroporphyrinogen decarboxylase